MDGKKNKKTEQLQSFTRENEGKEMTTNTGVKISNDENSLTASDRGPTLLEDFLMREKLSHFDRERIPERVVHTRGYGAHGIFELYESLEELTMTHFLQDPSKKTPLFIRFSEVAGSKGANETNRDVRGFAVKFYTEEGNFDLVGNNIPIFFIQDGIKFPDLIHALKPEPHNEIPQGQTAHDTFWDFIANNQESAAMMMWIMSDRAIPRSFRMMQGFGVHTFRLVNKNGKSRFVKFHWKPKLGVHSLIWDEAQKLGGADPDYHRRDLWENINAGNYPEYELGIQILEEEDEFKYDFDILDATKIWPEEDFSVKIIGKMTLNRNVDNVFAETEQVALHPGSIVRGIDFTNDPLLQGRLFSYTDTQLARVGTNYQELPINRPICPFHNNQRDGASKYIIDKGKVAYHNNSLANNSPYTVPGTKGGFVTYPSTVSGHKTRETAASFKDHFSQARLFWNSMSHVEKIHIMQAFSFELGKVKSKSVRQQVVDMIGHISTELATLVAEALGAKVPNVQESNVTKSSPALSMANTTFSPNTLRVGVIVANGYDGPSAQYIINQFKQVGLQPVIVSERLGIVQGTPNGQWEVNDTFLTGSPLLYDGLLLIGGKMDDHFLNKASSFVVESYNHFKPIGSLQNGSSIIQSLNIEGKPGVLIEQDPTRLANEFIKAMTKQRFWDRAYS
ncbi:catalase [Bacillus thuringiensis]|uniref:catalase n=1 Tax=Bacillus thuringiensis TaxID=1428 RepID=UPI000BF4BA5B|nr:catalase [Bacillus thuringiensis]PFP05729.1 catalase HPII [Bacillus thuringiensis]PGP52150.1 catalase HPII [Bacillus thuringiensis]PGY58811.1 catalase HPII [Bacillus thuringiensis]